MKPAVAQITSVLCRACRPHLTALTVAGLTTTLNCIPVQVENAGAALVISVMDSVFLLVRKSLPRDRLPICSRVATVPFLTACISLSVLTTACRVVDIHPRDVQGDVQHGALEVPCCDPRIQRELFAHCDRCVLPHQS
jgi:hypothetical protein